MKSYNANIGFDIDGVLTDIAKFQLEEGKKFFKCEPIDTNGFTIKDMFGCSEEEEYAFWKKNLVKYAISSPVRKGMSDVISKLRKDGNKVYIISSRKFAADDNFLGKVMRTIVKENLKANKIEYDKLVFCTDSKEQAIKDNYISVMIEDNPDNIINLSKLTSVIGINCNYNKSINNCKMINPEEIEDLYKSIEDILDKNEKHRKDPITVLAGKQSIDRPQNKFYSELQSKVSVPEVSIYQYLVKNNINNLDSTAISYFDKTLTFREFFRKIDECAKALKIKNVKKGDIVTVCMPNTPEGIIAFYAINKIGAVADMIHPLSSENEIKNYLNDTKSKVLIMSDFCFDKVNNIIKDTSLKTCIISSPKDSMSLPYKLGYSYLNRKNNINIKNDDNYQNWTNFIELSYSYDGELESEYDKNNLAVLLHTGGSTGVPKAVMISNEEFNANTEQLKFTIPSYKKGDSLFAITPIFHGFGLSNCVHTALSSNLSISLLPQYNEKLFTKVLLKDKSNLILGVPTLWDAMMKNKKLKNKNLDFLKVLISGGDNLPEKLEIKMNNFLESHNAPNKIFKGYGMTEGLAATSFSQPNANKLTTVGIPLPLNNYKIVKPNTCEELDANEQGEICISGPTIMLGYYNNQEETNKVLKIHDDGKKWLHTGDIGYRTEEGLLYYTSRIKRIIISSGYNIYPSQIENTIRKHPAVKDCAVVAIPHPYKVNVPKAYIILNDDAKKQNNIDEEIKAICKEDLSKFSLPKVYEYVEELPKTKMGKIDYTLLEKQNVDKYYNEKNQLDSNKVKALKYEKK